MTKKATIRVKGGAGSGHHGHAGRPGEVGGSTSSGGDREKFTAQRAEGGYAVKKGKVLAHTFQRHASAKRYANILTHVDNPVDVHTSFVKILSGIMNSGEYSKLIDIEKAAIDSLEDDVLSRRLEVKKK